MLTRRVEQGEDVVLVGEGAFCELHRAARFPFLFGDIHQILEPLISWIIFRKLMITGLLRSCSINLCQLDTLVYISFLHLTHLI